MTTYIIGDCSTVDQPERLGVEDAITDFTAKQSWANPQITDLDSRTVLLDGNGRF